MFRLAFELKKLEQDGWVVEDADEAAHKEMILGAKDLQCIPATNRTLKKAAMRALYTPMRLLDPYDFCYYQGREPAGRDSCFDGCWLLHPTERKAVGSRTRKSPRG